MNSLLGNALLWVYFQITKEQANINKLSFIFDTKSTSKINKPKTSYTVFVLSDLGAY